MCINKNNFFLILYILFSTNTFSQIVDTNKIVESNLQLDIIQNEQYLFCELIITQNMFGKEQSLKFEYGSVDNIWGDLAQLHLIKLSELKKQKTLLNALNLMGLNGWEVIHTYKSSESSYVQEHFVFQKKIIKKNK